MACGWPIKQPGNTQKILLTRRVMQGLVQKHVVSMAIKKTHKRSGSVYVGFCGLSVLLFGL